MSTTFELPTPEQILNSARPSSEDVLFIEEQRARIENMLLAPTSNQLIVIVGPCSIHNYDEALFYAEHLASLSKQLPNLYIIMRTYFEKPRTRGGWKGFIYDPDLNDTCDIVKGLTLARKLLLAITKLRLPIACEFLDPITPQYLADLVSWGAIGARTAESQIHRQLASGLSMPVGFKNLTDGNYEKAIDGILSASAPHTFLGINMEGKAAKVTTPGNRAPHLILRGSSFAPNYDADSIATIASTLKYCDIRTRLIVDCSHGNSQKIYERQLLSAFFLARLFKTHPNLPIAGIMLESNQQAGSQRLVPSSLQPGKSITDQCISWIQTDLLLRAINNIEVASAQEFQTIADCQKSAIDEINRFIYTVLTKSDYGSLLPYRTPRIPYYPSTMPLPPNLDGELLSLLLHAPPELYLLCAERQTFSERVAQLKWQQDTFKCLLNTTDIASFITNIEREQEIFSQYPHPFFRKLIIISKHVQLALIDKLRARTRIGYLFGPGTFSHEAVSKFAGTHIAYKSVEELYTARETGEVDYILLPTTNSLIGEILPLPPSSRFHTVGAIQHKIDLALFGNRPSFAATDQLFTMYLEPHVAREAESFLKTISWFGTESVTSTSEGVARAMVSLTPDLTIASRNFSTPLYRLKENIVPYNFTTFSLLE